jgi:hypothetical protein
MCNIMEFFCSIKADTTQALPSMPNEPIFNMNLMVDRIKGLQQMNEMADTILSGINSFSNFVHHINDGHTSIRTRVMPKLHV